MSKVIRISEANYEKMKLLAEPFEDTPDAVIGRALDVALEKMHGAAPLRLSSSNDVRSLDPDEPGELKHTLVRRVLIDGQEIPKANWNELLRRMHIVAAERIGAAETIRISEANCRPGRYEDDGYYYLPKANLSIQGQDSNGCWRTSYRLAQHLGIPIAVEFRWRDKEGATHPGEFGELRTAA